MQVTAVLAAGAENNGLANMLKTLAEQNLDERARLSDRVRGLSGRVTIIADDADVSTTLEFRTQGSSSTVTFHDGIVGIPDLTIRGGFEPVSEMSRMEMLGSLRERFLQRGAVGKLRQSNVGVDKALTVAHVILGEVGKAKPLAALREVLHELPDPNGEVNRSLVQALRSKSLTVHGLPRALPLLLGMGNLLSVH